MVVIYLRFGSLTDLSTIQMSYSQVSSLTKVKLVTARDITLKYMAIQKENPGEIVQLIDRR
jgi:hypothetical protein